jgi:hypothetical protein
LYLLMKILQKEVEGIEVAVISTHFDGISQSVRWWKLIETIRMIDASIVKLVSKSDGKAKSRAEICGDSDFKPRVFVRTVESYSK